MKRESERAVKVSGSAFIPAQRYTVKLEGAEQAGYQSIVIGSVRDPFIIRQIDDWTARLVDKIHARVKMVYGDRLKPDDYVINIRIYGKNGTMGPLEPVKEIRSHELCLLIEVTAPTQDIASSIAGIVRHQGLHLPIPEWSGLITALACPYNPAHLDRGAVYRFNVNHVVEPDDPYEMFPMELSRSMARRKGNCHDHTRRTRAPDPQQERGPVRAHVRHHVRRCGNLRARQTLGRGKPRGDCVALWIAGGEVKFFYCDNALAIKASIPRPYFQGDLLDSDGHGGQQYAPLMEIEIS